MLNNTEHHNQPILTIGYLKDAVEEFTAIIDHWYPDVDQHYQKEFIYSLRALTDEVRKQLDGKYCSLTYIVEKLNKLAICAEQFAVNDIEDYKDKNKEEGKEHNDQ